MSERKSILLADDHEVVRAGLCDALKRLEPDFDIVEAEDLPGTLDILEAPDGANVAVCVLDLVMPGMNGIDGVRKVIAHRSDLPVAVMSGSVRDTDIEAAMEAGASGFIPKTMKVAAIASALRLIMTGERYLPFEHARNAAASDSHHNLTPREMETLKAIAEGLSNKEIARHLHIEEVTVKLHAGNIFKKLNTANRTQAAMRAREFGII